jgi:elongation factor 1-beta
VAIFRALSTAPEVAKYPHAARWYKHIVSYDDDFATLPGDAAKPYTVYGPEVVAATLNPAKAPAAEESDEDDVDLFGSDDEEEDAEAARVREERLAEYRKKKEAKPKVAAKSVVILDVKPWGTLRLDTHFG